MLVYCLMVFSATFNNIAAISWRSVLLVKETGGPREIHRPVADKFYHIMLYTSPRSRNELTTSVVIGTDYISGCKSNYLTITTTTAPPISEIFTILFVVSLDANIYTISLEKSDEVVNRRKTDNTQY